MKCEKCGNKHSRKRFCSNKCKDRYHNKHNPRGLAVVSAQQAICPDIAEMAGNDYGSGWDEDGWLNDDSGVTR